MGLLTRLFGRSENDERQKKLKEMIGSYGSALRFLNELPGSGLSRQDYYEVNRLAGNPMSPQIMEENWKQGTVISVADKCDGTEYLRETLRKNLVEAIEAFSKQL